MGDPLISVVTPSYNQAPFLRDTLDSVRRQGYQNVEHVVVDGESTDDTVDILERYEDTYNLRWSSEPDEGQSDAINKGFERANGDIIGWLNSDDVYFDQSVFTRAIDHFERTGSDVVYGDLVTIDENSTVIGVDLRPDFDYDFLRVRTLIGQPAVFFRADVVANERLDQSLEYAMDYEFWLRLAEKYEFRHVKDLFAGFRRHARQKTTAQSAMRAQAREVTAEFGAKPVGARLLARLIRAECVRVTRSITACISLSRAPPELAFDGDVASLPRLLATTMPTPSDLGKFLERR